MKSLPTFGNYIIEYQTGDGFRSILPSLLNGNYLYIGNKTQISQSDITRSRCVTIHNLEKLLLTNDIPETMIVLDVRVPRVESKAFKALQKIVTDKSLILLHPPMTDVQSCNAVLSLLSLTKRKQLGVKRWSPFLYFRKYDYEKPIQT